MDYLFDAFKLDRESISESMVREWFDAKSESARYCELSSDGKVAAYTHRGLIYVLSTETNTLPPTLLTKNGRDNSILYLTEEIQFGDVFVSRFEGPIKNDVFQLGGDICSAYSKHSLPPEYLLVTVEGKGRVELNLELDEPKIIVLQGASTWVVKGEASDSLFITSGEVLSDRKLRVTSVSASELKKVSPLVRRFKRDGRNVLQTQNVDFSLAGTTRRFPFLVDESGLMTISEALFSSYKRFIRDNLRSVRPTAKTADLSP